MPSPATTSWSSTRTRRPPSAATRTSSSAAPPGCPKQDEEDLDEQTDFLERLIAKNSDLLRGLKALQDHHTFPDLAGVDLAAHEQAFVRVNCETQMLRMENETLLDDIKQMGRRVAELDRQIEAKATLISRVDEKMSLLGDKAN